MKVLDQIFTQGPLGPAPRPTPVAPSTDIPANYQALALRIGAKALAQESKIIKERAGFRAFLSENGIAVYEMEAVRKYLNKMRPWFHRVVWIGLNDMDIWDDSFTGYLGTFWDGYRKPIPEAVLLTAAKIRDEYSVDDAKFYVSDFMRRRRPAIGLDPFLAVRHQNEFFIIERWDEPGFRQ